MIGRQLPHGHRPGATGQVAALLRLRLAALRGPERRRTALGSATFGLVAVATVAGATALPRGQAAQLTLLLPTAWALFALGAVLATTSGTSARRLLPREQTVAFPISAHAEHLGALLLAPLNVAWLVQALSLLAVTSWVSGTGPRALSAIALTGVWIVAVTVAAQALGWLADLSRALSVGRLLVGPWLLRAVAAAGLGTVAVLSARGGLPPLLDRLPTRRLVAVALGAAPGSGRYLAALGQLLALAAVTYPAGVWLLGVQQRRPALIQQRTETRRLRRREQARSVWAAQRRVDRAAVWRSVPLRRGLVVLALVPGGTAALAALDWPFIALLPGLVAAGAGLLFGVNAFALDGSGGIWRESLPGSPRIALTVRLVTVLEACAAGALLAVVAAGLRAGRPTVGETVAVAGAFAVSLVQVLVMCAGWSVRRPHAADLREARDQPAPPAAMAGYSVKLSLSTTITGLVFAGLAVLDSPETAALVAAGLVLLRLRHLDRLLREWDDGLVRARVRATVAGAGI